MTRRQRSKPGRRGLSVATSAVLVSAVIALAPAAAEAAQPRITEPPVVAGTPQVGATVAAQGAEWEGRPEPDVHWQWVRCDELGDTRSCRAIDGATRTTYTATAADEGKRLRILLAVRNEDGWAWALSSSSPTVAGVPRPAGPDPAPPAPSPGSPPAGEPVDPGTSAPTGDVRDEQVTRPAFLMKPAPIVRIRGRLTRSGARITLLTVRAPSGARIAVRCAGRGCPSKRWARTASVIRIARFEAVLRAGTRLVIAVTKAGRIGKYTTILIRRGKAPRRVDRCLLPGVRKPVRCPRA